nr:hypothetical protein [Tanacetum cinerariifolium]
MSIRVKQDRRRATTAMAQGTSQGTVLNQSGQDNTFDDDVDEQPVQDLALNVDNVFQADDYDAFYSDVDETLTAQSMFMANLSSADPVTNEAGPSYDLDILSEVHDHDHYQDAVCAHHEEHVMDDSVQLDHVVDSHADYTSDSNMILYDQAKFELTEREQKINEQLRLVISDRNFKEETLKKELHFIKLQLASTINHNKSMVEEVTFLKRDFKQKEKKYLEDFLDMKSLKEKPALYNGHEIIKDNHAPAIVHNTEDTLEMAEITRKKINDKMNDPEWLPKDIYTLINHYTNAKDIWDNVKMLLEGSELTKKDRESQLNIKMTMSKMQLNSKFVNNMLPEWGRFVIAADDCDAFDSDMDEAPTAQTMFMANLSSAEPVTDKAGLSYDSDILSKVHDHDHYQDTACVHHEEHVMHDSVQLDHVVDSHVDYTSDINMISYDQYVKDNEVPVVHSDVSSVPNDAFMMIYNDICEPHAQSVSNPSRNTVVKNSLTGELATYKEQVKLYERHAMFELTVREQKINEQLRLVIFDRTFKEETLKKEIHSIKLQLASTIHHNKSMVEEVTFLKKDFKQKENKYLEDFLDMKSLKEKVEDRLIKQDQSLQTVHMLCRPKPYYNELNKDTLKMAEITRKKINDKMNDPECVTRKVKIAPHDYSKENFLATFTPQKQLTPEQIFWSNDLIKLKSKALKEQTTALTKEIKEMKNVFEELEAEVAQYAVHRKHDAIERKNLLIVNDNLIAECLSKEVFSVAINYELNVARFTEMHVANTIVEARCLALEAELANLRDKSHHDNQEELINHFSKLEVNYLNLHLKYQNLKDGLGNNPPTPDKDTPDFDSVFVIGKMQASLQGKDNVIRQLKSNSPSCKAENDKIKQHYKEMYDSIKITRAKHIEQMTALITKNVNLKAQTLENVNSVSKDQVKPKVLTRGKHAIDVEPIVPRLRNNRDVHLDYLRHLKESVETIRNIVEESRVVRPLDRSIVSACRYTKHSQELLEYAIGTCPQGSQQRDKQLAYIPLIRKKQVIVSKPSNRSDSNTHIHVVTIKPQKTNVPVPPSTRVKSYPNASGSQPKSHPKTNRISPAKGVNKLPVEDQPR